MEDLSPGDLFRLSGETFDAMRRQGLLSKADQAELLEGLIVALAPWRTPRINASLKAQRWLTHGVESGWTVRATHDLALTPDTRLRSDLCVMSPQGAIVFAAEFADRVSPAVLALRTRLYARGGVPELWTFDLPTRALIVQREPGREGYGFVRRLAEEEPVAPSFLSGSPIRAVDILPRGRNVGPSAIVGASEA